MPKDEATRKRQELIAKLNDPETLGDNSPTIEELGEDWFSLPSEKASKSLPDKKSRWRRFIGFISDHHPNITKACQVTPSVALEFTRWADTLKLTLHSRRLLVRLPGAVFQHALNRGMLAFNPLDGMARHLSKRRAGSGDLDPAYEERQPFTDEELTAIWNALNPKITPIQESLPKLIIEGRIEWWICIHFCFLTGMDMTDVVNLNEAQLNGDKESGWTLQFIRSKTGKEDSKPVKIPLDPRLRDLMDRYCPLDKKGFPFPFLRRRHMKQKDLSAIFSDLLHSLGIETTGKSRTGRARAKNIRGLKSLRHTFASRLNQHLKNPLIVQRAMGHKTMDMTAVYTHVEQKQLAEAVSSINLPTVETERGWNE